MSPPPGAEVPAVRSVGAHLEATVVGPSTLAVAVGVASPHRRTESLRATLDGEPVPATEVVADHGGRVHLLRDVGDGQLVVDYEARVEGAAPPMTGDEAEWLRALRPSRYCESDRIGPFARAEFAGTTGPALLGAVAEWVRDRLRYVPGSSRPIDGAIATLMAGEGVCRDFAHLTAALLRANDVAARVASVYAPGLSPMDFHAVTEALIDGEWVVVDPTGLAPRRSMVRIATGADAADTAFLTSVGGRVDLTGIEVTAVAHPDLPSDDPAEVVALR